MADSGWNTIDSDAGVFTELLDRLEVEDSQFDDLYSIDSDTLRQYQPLRGVIFLFKYSDIDGQYAKNGNKPLDGEYDPNYQEHGLFFANQTIQNACGTLGVINILLNRDDELNIGGELKGFKSFVTGFDSHMAGDTISNSESIRQIHNSFSAPTPFVDPDVPDRPTDSKNDGLFHFISYIRKEGYIYELDGLKNYPIRHVECKTDEEFVEKLPDVIMKRIEKYGGELRFSLLALTNDKLKLYELIGDSESVGSELRKRELWRKDNEFRRHNYIGLTVQLLKNISKNMNDAEWEDFIEKGRKRGQAKLLRKFSKGN